MYSGDNLSPILFAFRISYGYRSKVLCIWDYQISSCGGSLIFFTLRGRRFTAYIALRTPSVGPMCIPFRPNPWVNETSEFLADFKRIFQWFCLSSLGTPNYFLRFSTKALLPIDGAGWCYVLLHKQDMKGPLFYLNQSYNLIYHV